VGGAAVLETLMEELKIDEIMISDRGVREGLLVDYLGRMEGSPHAEGKSVRDISVLQLGRSCNVDEGHAGTVVAPRSCSLRLRPQRPASHDLGEEGQGAARLRRLPP